MQALENNPQAAQEPMQSGAETKTITDDDIQQLLKTIQQLSASGNREEAARMLAVLQNILEKSAFGAARWQQRPGQVTLNNAIQKFGDMMGKERSLLDKTMSQRQGSGRSEGWRIAGTGQAAGRSEE